MRFQSIMHIAFFTNQMDEMLDFYVNKLGAKKKVVVKYGVYLNRDDRPAMQEIARVDPERIFNAYLEIAPGQFLELFPTDAKPKPGAEGTDWDGLNGYSHFALLVEDIFQTREELLQAGIQPDTDISKGPSETYQMWIHDPDGNKFEIMQYTENSIQVKGNC